MIGRTGSWLWWAAGFLCAFVFGRGAGAREPATPEYGVRVRPRQPIAQPSDSLPNPKPAATLEDSVQWKQVCSAWAAAEKLLATAWQGKGQAGRDQEPKKSTLDGLDTAKKSVDALLAAGLLEAGEAEMLRRGLGTLESRVSEWATIRPACYAPPPPPPPPKKFDSERYIAKQLAARLPLLESLASQKRLQPAVVGKTLLQLNSLLDESSQSRLKDGNLEGMPAEERAEIARTRDAAKAAIGKVRALLAEASRPTPEVAAQVEALIKALGAADFAEREAASDELVKIGLPALAALREAAKSGDAEVADRARNAIAAIEGRPLPRRDLAPSRADQDEIRRKLQAEEELKKRQLLLKQQGGK